MSAVYEKHCSELDKANTELTASLREWAWLSESYEAKLSAFARSSDLSLDLSEKAYVEVLPLLKSEAQDLKDLEAFRLSEFAKYKKAFAQRFGKLNEEIVNKGNSATILKNLKNSCSLAMNYNQVLLKLIGLYKLSV